MLLIYSVHHLAKLDGVGLVDVILSTDYLHRFVQKLDVVGPNDNIPSPN